jgi:DNA modification methylase
LPELDLSAFDFDFGIEEDEEVEIVEDEAPPVDEQSDPIAKLGDIWQLGRHRLMCGSSTDPEEVAELMDGVVADMCFTDPPYNCNYGNIKHPKFKARAIENDNMDTESFRNFCTDFTMNIKENVSGCVYMCAGQGQDGRVMFTVADELLHNSTTIIWNKDQFTLGRGKYQNKYEPIWFGWVESGKDFTDDRTLTNVWDMKRPKKSELHPTMKPVELVEIALKHNPRSKTVLDLFGGSGTTLMACEQMDRTCYMMELDPKYCDVIIKRWESFTGEKAVLLND